MPDDDAMTDYLFDLRGYRVLPAALAGAEVRELNRWIDSTVTEGSPDPPSVGRWYGNVEVHSYYTAPDGSNPSGIDDGVNLQHIYEGGSVWEELLDHPSWWPLVQKYLGASQPFVHEMFANLRGAGGFIGVHSGGWRQGGGNLGDEFGAVGTSGHIRPRTGELLGVADAPKGAHEGQHEWALNYLSIILALTDVGEGDGATVLVPGSHKSLFAHPRVTTAGNMRVDGAVLPGAQEVHLKAGDAVLFNDHLLHGASARTTLAGQRRMVVFRYLPQDSATNRFGYEPSEELMARLTPARRQMLVDLNHPDPQPWSRRGRHSPRSAVKLTGQYGAQTTQSSKAGQGDAEVAPSPAKL